MKVPAKVVILGDKEKGKLLLSRAFAELDVLTQQMTYRNLKQSTRQIRPYIGAIIKCIKVFSHTEIIIAVSEGVKQHAKVEELIKRYECFCSCCFSFGKVDSLVTYVEELSCPGLDEYQRYNVKICQKDKLILFLGCQSLDYRPLLVGDTVIVIVNDPSCYSFTTFCSTACSATIPANWNHLSDETIFYITSINNTALPKLWTELHS